MGSLANLQHSNCLVAPTAPLLVVFGSGKHKVFSARFPRLSQKIKTTLSCFKQPIGKGKSVDNDAAPIVCVKRYKGTGDTLVQLFQPNSSAVMVVDAYATNGNCC